MEIATGLGVKAPEFNLPGIDGRNLSLESLLGSKRAIVVVFTCNHCPYCVAYEGRLRKMQEAYAGKGIAIVRINPDNQKEHPEDSFEEMKKRAAGKGPDFLYLRDEEGETAKAYGAKTLPEVFLLDSEGIVRYSGRIDDHWPADNRKVKRHDLKHALEDLLNDREIAVKVTKPSGCAIKWP